MTILESLTRIATTTFLAMTFICWWGLIVYTCGLAGAMLRALQ